MKNNKVFLPDTGQVINNQGASRFIRDTQTRWRLMFRQSGFDRIPSPIRVRVYVEIYLNAHYKRQDLAGLPKGDIDNMYTTLQEILQADYADIIDDDVQVQSFGVDTRPADAAKFKKGEGAVLWLWTVDVETAPPAWEEFSMMRGSYERQQQSRFEGSSFFTEFLESLSGDS